MSKAVVLLSGGLDSAVALSVAKSDGHEVYALSFDYGQRHSRELRSARAVAERAGVAAHHVVSLKLDSWGGSALTDSRINIEDGDVNRTDIPVTYVPARNLSLIHI